MYSPVYHGPWSTAIFGFQNVSDAFNVFWPDKSVLLPVTALLHRTSRLNYRAGLSHSPTVAPVLGSLCRHDLCRRRYSCRRAPPTPAMRAPRALALAALALALVCSARADASVDAKMEQLKASIGEAEAGLRAAHEKKDVVDLGASLRLVEGRFAGLRTALLSEMGSTDSGGGGGVANSASVALKGHADELTNKGGELINKLGNSRAQVHAVLGELRTMDSATAELKKAIVSLEVEIADLGKTLGQAHVDNSVLFSAHSDLRDAVHDVHSRAAVLPDATQSLRAGMVPKWYYLVFLEFGALLLFGGYKVYWMRRRDKFSKLG